jgi:hypothetical protein
MMEADSRDEALRIVPPYYHKDTKITRLTKFNLAEVQNLLKDHGELIV